MKVYQGRHFFYWADVSEKSFLAKDLPADLKRHFKARRLSEGEKIYFLNGHGKIFLFLQNSESFEFQKVESQKSREPSLNLYLSPPKGDDFSLAISQATEMGFEKIYFIRTLHNQNPSKSEPWVRAQRIAQASLEQCGLAFLPQIYSRWLSLESALKESENAVFADESSSEPLGKISWTTEKVLQKKSYSLFVGPEGGWSSEELGLLSKKAAGLCLGPNILKVPTAIVAAGTFLKCY